MNQVPSPNPARVAIVGFLAIAAQLIDTDLLDIIGLIYEAVADPSQWEAALEAIRVRHGWINASLSIIALPQRTAVLMVGINIQPEGFTEEQSAEIIDLWGGQERLAQMPLEEPVLQSNVTSPEIWEQSRFYWDWVVPRGIVDQVGIALARDRTTMASIGFAQHEAMVVEPWMIEELRILAPHLRRAATISRLLENSVSRAATFEAALNSSPAGAVLVRADMEIVHANAVGDAMLERGDPIRSVSGRMRLVDEVLPGQLETAVAAAAEGAAGIGRRGIGIPARRADGSPLVIHVLPLAGKLGGSLAADAIVFVAEAGGATPVAGASLELLFGLTPAESRAFELVSTGLSSREAATAMGVAESTLRSHLIKVYDKTGRHSRAGLMQLARELKMPD